LLNIGMSYCYKELDLENFELVQAKLIPYIADNYPNKKDFWNVVIQEDLYQAVPEFKQCLESTFGSVPHRVFLLVVPNASNIDMVKKFTDENSLHQDSTVYPYRVNWPILNSDSIETKFFTSDQEPNIIPLPTGQTYKCYQYSECKEIDSFYLSKPTIFNTSVIHGLFIKKPVLPRYILSLEYEFDLETMFPGS